MHNIVNQLYFNKKKNRVTSLAVQRLRLHISTAVGTGLISGELRSHMLSCVAKEKKKKKQNYLRSRDIEEGGWKGRRCPGTCSVAELPLSVSEKASEN